MDILLLILLFVIKHFMIDFVLQTQEEVDHKGTYSDWRGVKHSVKHGIGTLLVLWFAGAGLELSYLYAAADLLIHYHVDWAKMNINKKMGWGPTTHEEFWWLLGADQLAHALTYVWLVSLVTV